MIVMPANNAKGVVHYLAGRYPGRLGWLLSPAGWRTPPEYMPYALDNGRFVCWSAGKEWDEAGYLELLDKATACEHPPLWALVPDVVADRDATLVEWDRWAPLLRARGLTLAFAAQDGMTAADVPADAEVVFVGGSTAWKWRTLLHWTDSFPRVHVGRVNTERWLNVCDRAGVESCDGTGWFRGDQNQLNGLKRYLARAASGAPERQGSLF